MEFRMVKKMYLLSKKSIFFYIIIIAFACSDDQITEIKVLYLPRGMTVMTPVDCSNIYIFSEHLQKGRIKNLNDKIKIKNILGQLKPDSNANPVDARIKCFIEYGNNKTDTLCLGEFFGILLNGERMQDDSLLFRIIKSSIYNSPRWPPTNPVDKK